MPYGLSCDEGSRTDNACKHTLARHDAIAHGAPDGTGMIMALLANRGYFEHGTVRDHKPVAAAHRADIQVVEQQILSKCAGFHYKSPGGKLQHISACHDGHLARPGPGVGIANQAVRGPAFGRRHGVLGCAFVRADADGNNGCVGLIT